VRVRDVRGRGAAASRTDDLDLVTGGAGGALLAFLVYGGWELLRPSRPGRGGRLAGAAATTFAVAVVFIAYAWSCTCS